MVTRMEKKSSIYSIFCNGSVGKTTLTTNMALATAMKAPNEKILIVDCDYNRPNLELFNEGIIVGAKRYQKDALENGGKFNELITKTIYDNFDLLLGGHNEKYHITKGFIRSLYSGIESLRKDYDKIFLDIGSGSDSSIGSNGNGGYLSPIINMANQKYLVVTPDDKMLSSGLKTVTDYGCYLIKKASTSTLRAVSNKVDEQNELKNGDKKRYKSKINDFKKIIADICDKGYNTLDELCENIEKQKDKIGENVNNAIQSQINKTLQGLELGIIFTQVKNPSDVPRDFYALGKAITGMYSNPRSIKVNNMNGFGYFSDNKDLVNFAINSRIPIVAHGEKSCDEHIDKKIHDIHNRIKGLNTSPSLKAKLDELQAKGKQVTLKDIKKLRKDELIEEVNYLKKLKKQAKKSKNEQLFKEFKKSADFFVSNERSRKGVMWSYNKEEIDNLR